MSAKREPALRRATPKEELARLHPVERALFRVFEFFASLKLAVFLMFWLIVELSVGTFVESQVNTSAAKYFIYSHWRFHILLALLALNILSAALIRFPWKRYQTGFVITHTGLLTILGGSMITALSYLDTLMSVQQGTAEKKIFNQDAERLVVSYRQSNGKTVTQTIPVNFGPFTWGHKIFGKIPWRDGYVEEHKLENGDLLKVTKFFSNCTPEENYVESEGGVPAVQFRLFAPNRFDITQWLSAKSDGFTGREDLGPGSLVMWRVDTPAEMEHFLQAVPHGDPPGPMGSLGYSHGGKHHVFSVDELKKGPIKVPDSNVTLTLLEYLPNARPGKEGRLISEGEVPVNPALRVKVSQDGKDLELLTFGKIPEFSPILNRRYGTEHLLSYFPVDMPAVIHLAVGPGGKLGYRAFGQQGLIAAEAAEQDKEYPSWAGMTFIPKKIVEKGRPDYALRLLPSKRGKPGNHGIIVELESGKETFRAGLSRGMSNGRRFGDKLVTLKYDIEERDVPFQVQLDSFEEPKNPGTMQAAMYTSYVTLTDEDGKEQKAKVTMNAPLHYTDKDGQHYTLYQSGIDHSTGVPISTFTVADDPGLQVKYAGAIILCSGIVMMFYMGGYFKKAKVPTSKGKKQQQVSMETEAEPVMSL